jgi:hypothetical protein
MQSEPKLHPARWSVAVALAAIAAGLAAGFAPTLYVPCDFIAFWSSAVVFADGRNPYDPTLLLPLQHDAGFRLGYAITMFNPPWVLPVLAPLAALSVKAAFAVWLGVQLALVLVAAGWLWRVLGGSAERAWVAAVVAVTFAPTFLLLTGGQLTGLALFGFAGFLRYRADRPYLAGCLGALTAVKPHLFGLFAVALVIDAVRSRDGRKAVLAGTATLVALTAIALAVDPGAFAQYAAAITAPSSAISRGMTDYPSPVVGVLLRSALPGVPGAAFLPLLLAVGALLAFAGHLPPVERWPMVMPWLVAASLVVAPYGGWWYDMILLLPLLLVGAVRLNEACSPVLFRAGFIAFVFLDLAVMLLYARREQLTPLFALVPPLTALGCFALLVATRRVTAPVPAGA